MKNIRESTFMVKNVLHTPESRFVNLKYFPFRSHWISVNGLEMHYLDEGPPDANPVLLLHGVPAWSYLYRNIIQKIAGAGYRAVAPDLIGFGKSDKPRHIKDHTFRAHIEWIHTFIDLLCLKGIILFGHDWGSLIGLRIAAEHPELFAGIIISNGMLPAGDHKMHLTFRIWKTLARYSPFLPVDLVIASGMKGNLGKEERSAYNAPFPSMKYKAGVRALPGLVPLTRDDPEAVANRKALESLAKYEKPFLTVFSNADPITRGGDIFLQKKIPGACGQDHVKLDGGHFIQEESSARIADIIVRFAGKASM